jgi:hypothetical protein
MAKKIPTDILNYILNTAGIKTFYNLSNTCHHFYNLELTPILNDDIKTIPNFLLLDRWSKTLINKKIPTFQIKNLRRLILDLIYSNSLNTIKLIINHLKEFDFNSIKIEMFANYFASYGDYLIFCKKENLAFYIWYDVLNFFPENNIVTKCCGSNSDVTQPLLLFAYLFGTEAMLKLLLKLDIINDIDISKMHISYKTTKNKIYGNFTNFIIKMEKKNNWQTKNLVFEKILFKKLIDQITQTKNFNYVEKIIKSWDKSVFCLDFTKQLISIVLNINQLLGQKFVEICESNPDIMIKYQLILIANLFGNKGMSALLIDLLLWPWEDKLVEKISIEFNLFKN